MRSDQSVWGGPCLLSILILLSGMPAWGQGKGGDSGEKSLKTLQKVKQRLRAAEQDIDKVIQAQKKRSSTPTSPDLKLKLDEFEERMANLEDDLDNLVGVQDRLLEAQGRDRLNWSGSFRVTNSNFHLVDGTVDPVVSHLDLVLDPFGLPVLDPQTGSPMVEPGISMRPRDVDKWYGGNYVSRLRLTMTYDITENLRFYGQLAVFKYLNEIKIHSPTLDMHANRYPRDPTLRIERAYFDWFIFDWLCLTVGRVASPEGPPAELRENTVRNATWGVQMVEAEMDTITVTFHFSQWLEDTYLRLFYIPFLTHTDFTLMDDTKLFSDMGIEPMHGAGVVFETKLPGLGQNLWQLGLAGVPVFRPRHVPITVEGVDEPIYPVSPTGQDLGSYVLANILAEFEDIGSSGLDLFAAYTMTILNPRNDRMVYEVPVSLPIMNPMTGEVASSFTGFSRVETGLASYEEGSGTTNLGHFVFVGFRYKLPFWGSYAPKIGGEFNLGTRYHVIFSSPSDLLINKLGTKGIAWEVYLIQQLIEEHLFMRIGFVQQRRDYVGIYIGPTTAVDQVVDNTYILMDARF